MDRNYKLSHGTDLFCHLLEVSVELQCGHLQDRQHEYNPAPSKKADISNKKCEEKKYLKSRILS